jgi:hypothetical protein
MGRTTAPQRHRTAARCGLASESIEQSWHARPSTVTAPIGSCGDTPEPATAVGSTGAPGSRSSGSMTAHNRAGRTDGGQARVQRWSTGGGRARCETCPAPPRRARGSGGPRRTSVRAGARTLRVTAVCAPAPEASAPGGAGPAARVANSSSVNVRRSAAGHHRPAPGPGCPWSASAPARWGRQPSVPRTAARRTPRARPRPRQPQTHPTGHRPVPNLREHTRATRAGHSPNRSACVEVGEPASAAGSRRKGTCRRWPTAHKQDREEGRHRRPR